MGANKPIEDIDATLLAATKSAWDVRCSSLKTAYAKNFSDTRMTLVVVSQVVRGTSLLESAPAQSAIR